MKSIKKICIIGGGNEGVATAMEISRNTDIETIILTSKATQIKNPFTYIDSITKETYISNKIKVTDNDVDAIKESDLLIITLPSFLVSQFVEKLLSFPPSMILFIPGYGGKEFMTQKLINKGWIILGFDRAPFVARLINPTTVLASKKESCRIACLKQNESFCEIICNILSSILDIKLISLNNYLSVSFTPSNPILHTSRIYSLFYNCTRETKFSQQIKFYATWNDDSSDLLLKMDSELQEICKAYSFFDYTTVIPLSIHYESSTIKQMTSKIQSIKSLHNIDSPLKEINGVYCIDETSRYFKEDFMYGLCNIKGFAEIVKIKTPEIDKVLIWYERMFDEEFFINNKYIGKSLIKTGIPQNFGYNEFKDLESIYCT